MVTSEKSQGNILQRLATSIFRRKTEAPSTKEEPVAAGEESNATKRVDDATERREEPGVSDTPRDEPK
jgi:hypothetical protein